MAKPKKQAIPTEENVDLLNQEDKVSETPATLVAPSPDGSYEANSEDGSKLSPNPAGFGFTSQRLVDSLPETGLVNVLYITPIKNAGENIVGYKKWRWDLETRSWKRVFGSIPALSLVDGGREQRAIVTNPNREKPKVFNEKVVFNGEVYIGGRKVTGEDKEGTYVEGNPTDDGETHEELVRIQIGDEQFDIPTQQGDEDIISQITKVYDEDENLTHITLPKGIVPLTITINTHTLYFKEGSLVDYNGQLIEGYEYDGYSVNENGNLELDIIGDISEQVINSLTYVKWDGTFDTFIDNSLILFNPSAYGGGTKLYKHFIAVQTDRQENATIITNSATPITSQAGIYTALQKAISAYRQDFPIFAIKYENGSCYIIQLQSDGTWSSVQQVTNFGTDTVTEL